MVSIVVPQPRRPPTAATVSQSSVESISIPNVSSERLALVTPNIQPLEPVASPPPLQMMSKPSILPQSSVPDESSASEAPSKPAALSKVSLPTMSPKPSRPANTTTIHPRVSINKFVRRLHDMLQAEQNSGIVEWRRGLLVLHSTDAFTKTILPRYFNTRNFKTLRRQLNYYGFVHVRSFSTTGSTTTALWVNQDLAKRGTADISSVLMLKRVEPCESAKSVEGRRLRKELAVSTIEDDIGVSAKSLQLEQIRAMASRPSLEDQSRVPPLVNCDSSGAGGSTVTNRKRSVSLSESTASSQYDDDAANLLLAFSKSNVSSSSLS